MNKKLTYHAILRDEASELCQMNNEQGNWTVRKECKHDALIERLSNQLRNDQNTYCSFPSLTFDNLLLLFDAQKETKRLPSSTKIISSWTKNRFPILLGSACCLRKRKFQLIWSVTPWGKEEDRLDHVILVQKLDEYFQWKMNFSWSSLSSKPDSSSLLEVIGDALESFNEQFNGSIWCSDIGFIVVEWFERSTVDNNVEFVAIDWLLQPFTWYCR